MELCACPVSAAGDGRKASEDAYPCLFTDTFCPAIRLDHCSELHRGVSEVPQGCGMESRSADPRAKCFLLGSCDSEHGSFRSSIREDRSRARDSEEVKECRSRLYSGNKAVSMCHLRDLKM